MTTRKDTDRPPVHAIVLLPCPFCGIKDAYKTRIDLPGGKQESVYVCDNCGARGPIESRLHRDGLAWNFRSPTPEYIAALIAASELLTGLEAVLSTGVGATLDRGIKERVVDLIEKYGQ